MQYKISTSTEVDDRINIVMEMLLDKKSRAEIVQWGSKKWNISLRQVDKYIHRAKKVIQDEYIDKYTESIIYRSVKRMEDLYKRNYENEDLAECLRVISKQNELLGTVIRRVDHTTKGKNLRSPVIMLANTDDEADD